MRRMLSENDIRKNNDELIINNGMTVSALGDVVIGKDLEVDGDVTTSSSLIIGETSLDEVQLKALLALLS